MHLLSLFILEVEAASLTGFVGVASTTVHFVMAHCSHSVLIVEEINVQDGGWGKETDYFALD